MALFGLRRNGLALLDEPTAGVDPGAREQITEMIRDAAKSRRCACVVTSHAVEDVAALCHRVGVMVDGAMLCLGAPQHLRTKHGKHLTLTVHAEARAEREEEETVSAKSLLGRKSSVDLDATVREAAPGATRVGAFGDGETSDAKASGAAQRAARAFGFIEGASEADDAALSEAKRVAARGAAESENADNASRTWELPASADLPSVLEALERLRADDESGIEGYAVGQASLEDVFLEFASRGAAQSDAQMMAMEDALHAHRLALAKK
jgi:ABC-type multidrug transport system ATPase subunit